MVGGRVVRSGRAQSHAAYYVAMAAIIGLLVLLCCYFCYFFISKIRELSNEDLTSPIPTSSRPSKEPVSYPIQPVVRDSATAMAALCRQLPAARPQADQVFPAGRSPDARRTDTGQDPDTPQAGDTRPEPVSPSEKLPAPAAAIPCIALQAAR